MTISRFETFVATSWLRHQLFNLANNSKQASLMRVLDTSATPNPKVDGYKEFYQQSHIPTSLYFSLHALCPSSPTSFHKYPVPDSNRFQDCVENLGISNDTHVITYDRSNTSFALKTWWLFRLFGHKNVSVLNGGFRKWLLDGFEVSTDEPKVERSTFQPAFNSKLIYCFEDMTDTIHKGSAQIIDSRQSDFFYNQKEKLPEGMVGGHLPGSKNIPYSSLFDEDGTFRKPSALKSVFDAAGVNLDLPVVATCQTAMTACGLAAATYTLGKETVPVYNGAFQEWSQRAEPDQIEED